MSSFLFILRCQKQTPPFWHQKINRNIERDNEVSIHYLEEGWTLLHFGEHEVKTDLEMVVNTIKYFVDEKRKKIKISIR